METRAKTEHSIQELWRQKVEVEKELQSLVEQKKAIEANSQFLSDVGF